MQWCKQIGYVNNNKGIPKIYKNRKDDTIVSNTRIVGCDDDEDIERDLHLTDHKVMVGVNCLIFQDFSRYRERIFRHSIILTGVGFKFILNGVGLAH